MMTPVFITWCVMLIPTLSLKMIGWVGDKIEDLSLGLFADADFAGCAQSLRSTSGSHLQVQGKFTRFPLAGGSKATKGALVIQPPKLK